MQSPQLSTSSPQVGQGRSPESPPPGTADTHSPQLFTPAATAQHHHYSFRYCSCPPPPHRSDRVAPLPPVQRTRTHRSCSSLQQQHNITITAIDIAVVHLLPTGRTGSLPSPRYSGHALTAAVHPCSTSTTSPVQSSNRYCRNHRFG